MSAPNAKQSQQLYATLRRLIRGNEVTERRRNTYRRGVVTEYWQKGLNGQDVQIDKRVMHRLHQDNLITSRSFASSALMTWRLNTEHVAEQLLS